MASVHQHIRIAAPPELGPYVSDMIGRGLEAVKLTLENAAGDTQRH